MTIVHRDARGTVSLGRWELAIQALILVNMVAFAIETMPNVPPPGRQVLWAIEVVSVIAFSIEYVIRLSLTRPWHRYVFSFFGIVDLLAILPFYLGLVIDLRSLRAMRLMRLFRLLKLARYSAASDRFQRAFEIAREELILFGTVALILLYLAAVGIHYFESHAQPDKFGSVLDSLWWAVVTMTTVGYGDVYPVTVGGKIFTFLVLFMGLGFIAVPTGLFVSALSRVRAEECEAEGRSAGERERANPPPGA